MLRQSMERYQKFNMHFIMPSIVICLNSITHVAGASVGASVGGAVHSLVTELHVYGPHLVLKNPQVAEHFLSQDWPTQAVAHFDCTVPQQLLKKLYSSQLFKKLNFLYLHIATLIRIRFGESE